jgi:hypothetical protein
MNLIKIIHCSQYMPYTHNIVKFIFKVKTISTILPMQVTDRRDLMVESCMSPVSAEPLSELVALSWCSI